MILSDHNVVLVYRNVLLIRVAEISTFSSCHLSGCDVCFGSEAAIKDDITLMSAFGRIAAAEDTEFGSNTKCKEQDHVYTPQK